MQVILFCLAIGRDPSDLKIGVVNHEMNYTGEPCPHSEGCHLTLLSCRYLQSLKEDKLIQVILNFIFLLFT